MNKSKKSPAQRRPAKVPPGRWSNAPYNFVPLTRKPLSVEDGIEAAGRKVRPWLSQDEYQDGMLSGSIGLEIHTETPLYIRCGAPREGEAGSEEHFYHHGDPARPVVPGSSLRGMTRALVEILGYAPLRRGWFSDDGLVFRAVAEGQNSSLGEVYQDQFQKRFTLKAGYLEKRGGGWAIRPAKTPAEAGGATFAQVAYGRPGGRDLSPPGKGSKEKYRTPEDTKQILIEPQKLARARRSQRGKLSFARLEAPDDIHRPSEELRKRGFIPARIVRTGHIPRSKKRHCAVFDPDPEAALVPIDWELWKRFRADQRLHRGITARPADREGDIVFYLTDADDELRFLGTTMMFRLPYPSSISTFFPGHGEQGGVSLAGAIFGQVGETSFKGRVFFEDAPLDESTTDPFLDGPTGPRRSPKILSTPKPTAFQHYLNQPKPESLAELRHWGSDPETTEARGVKRYWHKKDADDADRFEHQNGAPHIPPGAGGEKSQYTIIRPVRPEVQFHGRVRFENLTKFELGALLTALQLPDSKRHHLGMGKPVGLGSVRIETSLELIDRRRRYSALVDEKGECELGWEDEGRVAIIRESAIQAFERVILDHAGSKLKERPSTLWQLPRLRALSALLEWDEAPPKQETGYRWVIADDDLKWWRQRPVLPRAEHVSQPPSVEARRAGRKQIRHHPPPKKAYKKKGGLKQHGYPRKQAAWEATQRIIKEALRVGDKVKCSVLEETTKKGAPFLLIEKTDQRGILHPSSPKPPSLSPGSKLELVVKSTGQTPQLAWDGGDSQD